MLWRCWPPPPKGVVPLLPCGGGVSIKTIDYARYTPRRARDMDMGDTWRTVHDSSGSDAWGSVVLLFLTRACRRPGTPVLLNGQWATCHSGAPHWCASGLKAKMKPFGYGYYNEYSSSDRFLPVRVSSFPVGFSEPRGLRSGLESEALRVVLHGFHRTLLHLTCHAPRAVNY